MSGELNEEHSHHQNNNHSDYGSTYSYGSHEVHHYGDSNSDAGNSDQFSDENFDLETISLDSFEQDQMLCSECIDSNTSCGEQETNSISAYGLHIE